MSLTPGKLVKGSIRLSSLPEVYFRINDVMNDPNSSFGDIANVISSDVSLSARLMKIVNSAFYGFPEKIETITHAVAIVGTRQLHDLALSTTILSSFKGVPEKHINMNSFWRHSITCAIAARLIAIHNREPNPERLFLAGILHDIGRLILLENLPDEAGKIMERFAKEDKLLHQLERDTLGFDHADIGAALMKTWNLPESLMEIIAFHHDPLGASNFAYEASIIHLADILAKSMQAGSSGDLSIPPLEPDAWTKVRLKETFLPHLWSHVESQYDATVSAVVF